MLLGTQNEPDGSPHIIAQSVEFQVLQCLPGEQGCAPAGTDTRWFYDTDAIGSVRLITDDGGGTFARYDYAPFGEPTLAENPDNQRRFAGTELDAETGLNYFGARYFAAQLGRFAAADPGQADGDPLHPQSWNAYAYSRNNPLRFVDPLGACSLDDAGNPVEDNESSTPVYAGPCLRYNDNVTVTPSGPTFHDFYVGVFAAIGQTSLLRWDTNSWEAAGRAFFSRQPWQDAWDEGYYGCLAEKNLPGIGAIPTVHAVGDVAIEGAERNASRIAGAYYHFTDGRFTAWGRHSKVFVPAAAAEIEKWAGRLNAAGWAFADYELIMSIGECSEVLR